MTRPLPLRFVPGNACKDNGRKLGIVVIQKWRMLGSMSDEFKREVFQELVVQSCLSRSDSPERRGEKRTEQQKEIRPPGDT